MKLSFNLLFRYNYLNIAIQIERTPKKMQADD